LYEGSEPKGRGSEGQGPHILAGRGLKEAPCCPLSRRADNKRTPFTQGRKVKNEGLVLKEGEDYRGQQDYVTTKRNPKVKRELKKENDDTKR